jgi:hypothetical protein
MSVTHFTAVQVIMDFALLRQKRQENEIIVKKNAKYVLSSILFCTCILLCYVTMINIYAYANKIVKILVIMERE